MAKKNWKIRQFDLAMPPTAQVFGTWRSGAVLYVQRWLERSKAKETVTANIMGAAKITGLTFDRIIYRKKFQDEAILELIQE